MDLALGCLVMAMVPAYLILQPLALLRLSGRWRGVAAIPLILAIPAAAWSVFALAHESNLWPVIFILFAPAGTVYLAIVLVLSAVV